MHSTPLFRRDFGRSYAFWMLPLFSFMGLVSCNPATPQVDDQMAAGCTVPFDPYRDYFSAKVTPEDAHGFSVSYHKNYKVVRVNRAWPGTNKTFTYVLKACGAPTPSIKADAVITLPVKKMVTTSTTQLPALQQLGLLGKWVGHAGIAFITLPLLAERAKSITEVGMQELDAEKILALQPDVVMGYAMGAPTDVHQKLQMLPLKVVLNGEYAETTPLARTEWIKFTALFFNEEAKANQVYSEIKKKYQALQNLPKMQSPPIVFSGSYFNGNWYVAGANNFMAHLVRDAGADYAVLDAVTTLTLDFEGVLRRTKGATHWIGTQVFKDEASLRQADERFSLLPSAKKGTYFAYDGRFFEGAVLEPDVVLRDLRAILYPDLAKGYTARYFTGLQ